MKKIIYAICLSALSVAFYAQDYYDCALYDAQYEEFKAHYKNAVSLQDKEYWINQMEITLKDSKEFGCGLPENKVKEFNGYKKSLEENAKFFSHSTYTINADELIVNIGVKQKKGLKIIKYPVWLKPYETADTRKIRFYATANNTVYDRSDVLEVEVGSKRHSCIIRQKAIPLYVNITEHLGFGHDGGTCTIFVETNDTAWTVSGNAKWLKTEITDEGVKVECAANPSKRKRSATLRVSLKCGKRSQNVLVEQSLGKTTLYVPDKNLSFDNYGGINSKVAVNCNYDQWSAIPDVDWLHVKKKYGGISVACDANAIASARSASVKIETNNDDHLIEYIKVDQIEAQPYLRPEKNDYNRLGEAEVIKVPIQTNVPFNDWSVACSKGCGVIKAYKLDEKTVQVELNRNDKNSLQESEIQLTGKGQTAYVSFKQGNRGYAGRYRDYFYANGGNWRVTWLEADAHIMTTIGFNIAAMNVRWKPVEISLINFNIDYNLVRGYGEFGWEPVARGFLPVSIDGRWAAFLGMGAHISFNSYSAFLLEFGMECQWNEKYSSRMFFKYNGACSLGMTFDFGNWY